MGTGDKMLGGNLQWTSIPSRESSNTASRLHAAETGISCSSVGQFGPSTALTYNHVPSHALQTLPFNLDNIECHTVN